jgi:hypothetical protein
MKVGRITDSFVRKNLTGNPLIYAAVRKELQAGDLTVAGQIIGKMETVGRQATDWTHPLRMA